jgi:hypothetical protein
MNVFQKAALALVFTTGTLSAVTAQTAAPSVDLGLSAVASFYGVSEQEVRASELMWKEACLVGPAMRVLKNPEKAVPVFHILTGTADTPLEHRVLESAYRPKAGEFTWLQSAEGWYVVLPSLERFEVLLNRSSNTSK